MRKITILNRNTTSLKYQPHSIFYRKLTRVEKLSINNKKKKPEILKWSTSMLFPILYLNNFRKEFDFNLTLLFSRFSFQYHFRFQCDRINNVTDERPLK